MTAAPTPERIFGTLTAYQTSAALAAAIRLELFTHVAAGEDTLAALVRVTGASERGLRALCTHLVAHAFLEAQGPRYRLTHETAVFLDRRSPAYMGSVAGFLNSPGLVRCFDDALGAIQRGGTVDPEGGTTAAENPVWVEFARAMEPMARALAPGVADVVCRPGAPGRVLDVAAGHGLYGIEVARRAPACQVVFQDWSNVLAVARENVERAGLAQRAHYLAGSAFEVDLARVPGQPFDVVLVTNFLHHFERERCVDLLARCRAGLAPGGRVALLEFALEDDRVTPLQSAGFDFVLLATTPRGEAYTVSEYGRMFAQAGLAHPERHDLPPSGHTVLVAGAR
jgi:SAM-dependent methyltransferase